MNRDDRGVSSVQFLLASALGLLLFVALANLVVVQYGKGALRSALEQGVRAGSLSGDARACAEKVEAVVGELLAGRMSDQLSTSCEAAGGMMSATASVVFRAWTPLTPDFRFELESTSIIEPPP